MQRLEVSGAVRPIYGSLGVKRLIMLEMKWKFVAVEAKVKICNLRGKWQNSTSFNVYASYEGREI